MASDIWLRTILIVRKETRCHHIGYSFRLTPFYMHHPTDRITHTTAFVTPVVEHWLEQEIAQWVHPMKDRSNDPSHHERMLLPRSYISLPNSRRVLAGTRKSSMGPPHEGSIWRPIAPLANALTTELHLAPHVSLSVSSSDNMYSVCRITQCL